MLVDVPDHYPEEIDCRNAVELTKTAINLSRGLSKDGWVTRPGLRTSTIPKRHEDLILYKRYSREEYPKYDNYDAINVGKDHRNP